MSRVVVFLDGPPGAGKSTVLSHLAAKYKATVVQEPLVQWSMALAELEALEHSIARRTDQGDESSPEIFSEYTRYELMFVHFQTLVLSWYQQLMDSIPRMTSPKKGPHIIFVERSPTSAKAFHQIATANENRTEEFKEQVNMIGMQLPVMADAKYINLVLPPDSITERLAQRQAPGDTRWSVDTLTHYLEAYDMVMAENQVDPIKIDAMRTPEEIAADIYQRVAPKQPRRSRFDMFFLRGRW